MCFVGHEVLDSIPSNQRFARKSGQAVIAPALFPHVAAVVCRPCGISFLLSHVQHRAGHAWRLFVKFY